MAKPTPEQIIDSTLKIAIAILATDADKEVKRKFLNSCIWVVTEANGKFNVPYWSEGVYNLVQEHGNSLAAVLKKRLPIRHEHVNPRKHLVDKIMKDPACLEAVLREEAIACLVMKDEHSRLVNTDTGFRRYQTAEIRVWDVKAENWYTIE